MKPAIVMVSTPRPQYVVRAVVEPPVAWHEAGPERVESAPGHFGLVTTDYRP